ncbi:MAG: hypothetical protein ACKVLN_16145, partial [Rhodobacterales bacterium]
MEKTKAFATQSCDLLWRSIGAGGFAPFTLAVLTFSAPMATAGAPQFIAVDIPEHVYDGGWEYFVGGGMAVFDCDQDHLPDIFAAGGQNKAILLRNKSTRGGDLR